MLKSSTKKTLACAAILAATVTLFAAIQQPVGLFRLVADGDPVEYPANLDWHNVNMDGIRFQMSWAELEPNEGQYLWVTSPVPADCSGTGGNIIDRALCQAEANKKAVGFGISFGCTSPHWVYSAGVYQFNLDASDTTNSGDPYMPIIWQPLFQTKVRNFITALHTHINTRMGHEWLRYLTIGGVAKVIDMRTWCQNVDASTTVTDALLTDVANGGSHYTKVVSNTAHFTTTSNPNCASSFNCIVGAVINDNAVNLNNNGTVCSIASDANCPANPTDTTVYVNHATLSGTCNNCADPLTIINQWILGRGEWYQMNQIAISPPGGYGFVANPHGMDDHDGGPGTGSYVVAAEAIGAMWANTFPEYWTVLTRSGPYPQGANPLAPNQGSTDAATIANYLTGGFSNAGSMVVSQQATCGPHQQNPGSGYASIAFAKGAQAIYPSGNPSIYNPTCTPIAVNGAIQDLIEGAIDNFQKWLEIYQPDAADVDPLQTVNPTHPPMAAYERAKMRLYNPQPQDHAKIMLRN